MTKSQFTWLLITLSVAVLLPLMGSLLRRSGESGCVFDGQRIEPAFRVRIRDREGSHVFCCLVCAEMWLERQERGPREILVTDEPSGKEIAADSAYFVRSMVVTMKSTGNRIHVFQEPSDSETHARLFRGTILSDSERPFREQDTD